MFSNHFSCWCSFMESNFAPLPRWFLNWLDLLYWKSIDGKEEESARFYGCFNWWRSCWKNGFWGIIVAASWFSAVNLLITVIFSPKQYKLAARINWMNLQLHSFSLILLPRLQKIFEHFVQVTRVQSLLLLHFCSWYSYIRDLSGVINPFFSVLLIFFFFFYQFSGEKGIGPRTGKPLHYKGSFFHRVIKGSMAEVCWLSCWHLIFDFDEFEISSSYLVEHGLEVVCLSVSCFSQLLLFML